MRGLSDFKEAGERLFCISEERSFSYRELEEAILTAGRRLEEEEIAQGQVVAFGGNYTFSAVALLLALFRLRCVAVPLTGTAGADLESRILEAGAEWFLQLGDLEKEFSAVRRDVSRQHQIIEGLQAAGRAGLILFSSGSTGKPKGMLHDFERLVEGYRRGRMKDFRVLAFMGIDHIGGLDMLFRALVSKSALIIPDERSPG